MKNSMSTDELAKIVREALCELEGWDPTNYKANALSALDILVARAKDHAKDAKDRAA